MTLKDKKTIEKRCEQCKKIFSVITDNLDPDVEKTEDMKSHAKNYCPVCRLVRE